MAGSVDAVESGLHRGTDGQYCPAGVLRRDDAARFTNRERAQNAAGKTVQARVDPDTEPQRQQNSFQLLPAVFDP